MTDPMPHDIEKDAGNAAMADRIARAVPIDTAPPLSEDEPRRRRGAPEERLQMAVVKFLAVALDGNSEFFAVPNGGKRGFREAQRFKAAGVKAGVPDLIVINDGRAIGIELKAGKTPLSEAQVRYHEMLRRARVPVTVCRSIEDVEAALRAAGVPLRATSLPTKTMADGEGGRG